MKTIAAYILVFSMLAFVLTGCGELMSSDPAGEPMLLPEINDGMVRDDDGFITEEDTGSETERQGRSGNGSHYGNMMPSAAPGASPSASPEMKNGTATHR